MKQLYLSLFLLVTISFMACDGRDRLDLTPQEVLQGNKMLDSFSRNIIYTPQNYNEVENDTLFSSGYRIFIKYYTDMDNAIQVNNKEESKNHKHYYREFAVEIIVSKGDQTYFDKTIDKDFFLENISPTKSSLTDKYIKNVWVQDSDSIIKDKPIINIEFFSPTTAESIIYKIIVSENVYLILENSKKEE